MKLITAEESKLPQEVIDMYKVLGKTDNGIICGVHRLVFHWTLHIDISDYSWEDKYCFRNFHDAIEALLMWDGISDMPGKWNRHLKTGRRRNLETGEEWIAY
jgi:hypothetical protein